MGFPGYHAQDHLQMHPESSSRGAEKDHWAEQLNSVANKVHVSAVAPASNFFLLLAILCSCCSMEDIISHQSSDKTVRAGAVTSNKNIVKI